VRLRQARREPSVHRQQLSRHAEQEQQDSPHRNSGIESSRIDPMPCFVRRTGAT